MIYVMSDIHGNAHNFNSIMQQIKLQPDDTLYVLGDVIDRYPDGIKILRTLMSMPNVKMLLGNHEHMMLEVLGKTHDMSDPVKFLCYAQKLTLWYNNGGHETHSALKHIRKTTRSEIFEYLKSLPVNVDIEVNGTKYKLTHASPIEMYQKHGGEYRNEQEFAVWHRLAGGEFIPRDYILVFGHTPTLYFQDDDVLKIWYGNNMIGIDCGSGFPPITKYTSPEIGRLGCLRLDDGKEYYSE